MSESTKLNLDKRVGDIGEEMLPVKSKELYEQKQRDAFIKK